MRVSTFPRRALAFGLCLVLASALSSCGGGGGGGGGEPAGFQVTLTMRGANGAATSDFVFGNPIVFDITVVNRSGGTQVLGLPTSQIYDLAVFPEGSQTPRFRWSFNRTFTPAATNLSFTGHQSITYLYVWSGVLDDGTQIMPGKYDVRGTLAFPDYAADWGANDEWGAAPRRITVTP
jgi:hypothetical protein